MKIQKALKTVMRGISRITWVLMKSLVDVCKTAWQNYQRNKRLREIEMRKLRTIKREAEAKAFGTAQGMARGFHLGDYEGRKVVMKRKQRQNIDPVTILFGKRKKKRKLV